MQLHGLQTSPTTTEDDLIPDHAAIADLVLFSLEHELNEAISHFPMFPWRQIWALYEQEPDTRRQMLEVLLERRTQECERHHCHVRRKVLSGGPSAWQEYAIRCLEDG